MNYAQCSLFLEYSVCLFVCFFCFLIVSMMFVLFTRGTYSHLRSSLPLSACSVCVFSVGLNVTVYVHPFSLRVTSRSLYASLCSLSKPSVSLLTSAGWLFLSTFVVLHLISVSLQCIDFVKALVTDYELFEIKNHQINEIRCGLDGDCDGFPIMLYISKYILKTHLL